MQQARLRLWRPVSGRLLSRVFRDKDLTVNLIIVSAFLCLLSGPSLLRMFQSLYAWLAFQLTEGFLVHLPGVSLFMAIAGLILFVQEVEKHRRQ